MQQTNKRRPGTQTELIELRVLLRVFVLWFKPEQTEGGQSEPKQVQRMRRLGRVSLLPIGYGAALASLYCLDLTSLDFFLQAAAVLAFGLLVFFVLFASNLNLKARDKNLISTMTLSMIGVMLWILYMEPSSQISYGPFVLLVIMSGAFRLRQKDLITSAVVAVAGNALIIILHYIQDSDFAPFRMALLHAGALLLSLPGIVYLGVRLRDLYRSLYTVSINLEHIEEHARRDELTGCFNRRYMMAALQQQKKQADDDDESLCLAVIDLDHFKRINDEVGHLAGDEVLRSFAKMALQSVRKEDIFGRYGGEEFLLLLPDIDLSNALNTVERLRAMIDSKLGISAKLERKVTVSIGLTQYISGESVLDLFARADAAMYVAKSSGRNRVVVKESSEETKSESD